MMKSKKVRLAADPIMMFGGSPIKVAVPPMLEARISAIRYGTGFIFSVRQSMMVMGPMSKMVVTLSNSAEKTAVMMTKATMMSHGLPLQSFADLMATYSKSPDWRTTATNIIMPQSTPSVLKSMDSMLVSKSTTPMMMRATAPSSAASARWILSETTSAMTMTNTTTETI